MAEVSQQFVIQAPRKLVYRVLTDYLADPEFVPNMENTTLHSREGLVATVGFDLRLMVLVHYDLRIVETPEKSLEWSLDEGRPAVMALNQGSWHLRDTTTQATEVDYTLEIALRSSLPTSVHDHLLAATLPKTLEAFKQRCEQLSGHDAPS